MRRGAAGVRKRWIITLPPVRTVTMRLVTATTSAPLIRQTSGGRLNRKGRAEGGRDREGHTAVADRVGGDLALPLLQRASHPEGVIERLLGLQTNDLVAGGGADRLVGQHEGVAVPADARHGARTFGSLNRQQVGIEERA